MAENTDKNYIHIKEYFEKIIDLRFDANRNELNASKEVLKKDLDHLNALRTEVLTDRSEFIRAGVYNAKVTNDDKWQREIDKRLTVIETRSITYPAALALFFIITQIMLWVFSK